MHKDGNKLWKLDRVVTILEFRLNGLKSDLIQTTSEQMVWIQIGLEKSALSGNSAEVMESMMNKEHCITRQWPLKLSIRPFTRLNVMNLGIFNSIKKQKICPPYASTSTIHTRIAPGHINHKNMWLQGQPKQNPSEIIYKTLKIDIFWDPVK